MVCTDLLEAFIRRWQVVLTHLSWHGGEGLTGSTAMRRVRVPVLLVGICLLTAASALSERAVDLSVDGPLYHGAGFSGEDANMDAAVAESRHDERSLDSTSFSEGSDGAGRSSASKVRMCVRSSVVTVCECVVRRDLTGLLTGTRTDSPLLFQCCTALC